ncbi:MAG: co-chaperone GroES [Myxococcales bacterium]|nr:co-chaperone GroES [Myxococcales bacterium]MCB9524657.1 co-chaperone GroES [Myxococcales bacterium]
MNLQPLNGYVLIEQSQAETRSAGGLILPDTAQEAPTRGIIRAMAADASDEIDVGDEVIYKKYSGEELKWEGATYRLVPAGDLLCKIVETDAIPD